MVILSTKSARSWPFGSWRRRSASLFRSSVVGHALGRLVMANGHVADGVRWLPLLHTVVTRATRAGGREVVVVRVSFSLHQALLRAFQISTLGQRRAHQ
jgi:hypothetical protein